MMHMSKRCMVFCYVMLCSFHDFPILHAKFAQLPSDRRPGSWRLWAIWASRDARFGHRASGTALVAAPRLPRPSSVSPPPLAAAGWLGHHRIPGWFGWFFIYQDPDLWQDLIKSTWILVSIRSQYASKDVVASYACNSTSAIICTFVSHRKPQQAALASPKVDACHVVNIETSYSVIPMILAATCLPSQIAWSTTAGSFKTLMPSAGAVSKENLGFSLVRETTDGACSHNFWHSTQGCSKHPRYKGGRLSKYRV